MRRGNILFGALACALLAAAPAPADFLAACDAGLVNDPGATKTVRDFLCTCYAQGIDEAAAPGLEEEMLAVINTPKGPGRWVAVREHPTTYPIFRTCSEKLLNLDGKSW
ncbi:MAG: hypothetical protein H6923_04795 [Alphaproteobacteria bacterium]|nr:hypothetical protein [Alphaproteobacteria bacterium]